MGMPAPQLVTTIEELLDLPEDGMRHELLDGVHVVTPSPAFRHQRVLRELFRELDRAVQDRGDVELLWSPADIRLGPRTLVQPDLFVLPSDPDNPSDQAASGVG
jgi:Uma2 family endonuclease